MKQKHINNGELYNCYGCIASLMLKDGIGCTNQQTFADHTSVTMTLPGGKMRFKSITPSYVWEGIAALENGRRDEVRPNHSIEYIFWPKKLGKSTDAEPTEIGRRRQKLRSVLILEEIKELNRKRAATNRDLYPETSSPANWPRLEGRRPTLEKLADKRGKTVEELLVQYKI